MAKLNDLPIELIAWVAGYLEIEELAEFVQTARKFYHIVDPILYTRAKDVAYSPGRPHGHPLRFAAEQGRTGTLRKCIAAGFDVNMQLNENMQVAVRSSLCLRRRLEAVEGKGIWDKETATVEMQQEQQHEHESEDEFQEGSFDDSNDSEASESGDSEFDDLGTVRRHRISDQCSCILRALHLAVVGGHDEAVEVLLDHGADIDAPSQNVCDCPSFRDREAFDKCKPNSHCDPLDTSSLHLAICHFRESTAKLLLKRGASIMTTKPFLTYSRSALHTAAATGQSNLCAYMLDEGFVQKADISDDSMAGYGFTPLYWAYYYGQWKTTFPALLERGADINIMVPWMSRNMNPPDDNGSEDVISRTLLYEACRHQRFEDALRLIRLGTDVNGGECDKDYVFHSPLHAVCSRPERGTMSLLNPPLRFPRISRGGEDLRRQLIQVLIEEGADIACISYNGVGNTPLTLACAHYNVTAVEALIAAGADVNFKVSGGKTPLMSATSNRGLSDTDPYHAPIRGIRPTSYYQGIPLMSKTRLSSTYTIVKLLLDHGAEVNGTDNHGRNSLYKISSHFNDSPFQNDCNDEADKRLVRLLLDRGGDPYLQDRSGRTPFHMALLLGQLGLCEIFLRNRPSPPPLNARELCEIFDRRPSPEIVDLILDLDTKDLLRGTSEFVMQLYDASSDRALCAYLERRPPRLNATEKGKILCLAVKSQSARLIKHMLALKAPVNFLGAHDTTPLHEAFERYVDGPGLVALVKDLLAAGADIHFGGNMKRCTPLERAIQRRRLLAIKQMLRHRPLGGDSEAPKGVYLHAAVRLGLQGFEIVGLLIRYGASLTERDENGDTPLACLLRETMNPQGWMKQYPQHKQHPTQFCALIQKLWNDAIDIRARNKSDKSIIGYFAALKLYQGDNRLRLDIARQLRQQVKVVPVPGNKPGERATLEFQPNTDQTRSYVPVSGFYLPARFGVDPDLYAGEDDDDDDDDGDGSDFGW